MRIVRSVFAAFTLICSAASAQADEEALAAFYKTKVVTIYVSTSAGGGYDTVGRAIAKVLGRHLPGHPAVVVKNMAGAGGVIAANFLFTNAEKDGATIGLLQDSAPFKAALGVKEARYVPSQFKWLGSPGAETGMLITYAASPVKTIEDARTREATVGAAAVNSLPAFYARLMNEIVGTKLKVIVGYPGLIEAFSAMERGEIDGYPSAAYSTLMATKREWLTNQKINTILYYGGDRRPELKGAPFVLDLISNPEDRILMEAATAPLSFGKLFVMPPGVPAERVEAMRKAVMAAFTDPEFKADADRMGIEADLPRDGVTVEAMVARLADTPPAVLERLKHLIGDSN